MYIRKATLVEKLLAEREKYCWHNIFWLLALAINVFWGGSMPSTNMGQASWLAGPTQDAIGINNFKKNLARAEHKGKFQNTKFKSLFFPLWLSRSQPDQSRLRGTVGCPQQERKFLCLYYLLVRREKCYGPHQHLRRAVLWKTCFFPVAHFQLYFAMKWRWER